MTTKSQESLAGTSRNGSIPHPHRGTALAMWETFSKAKGEIDIAALAEKNDWNANLARFHLREWKLFTGQATKVTREAAPAKKVPAKKAAAKKTAAKKVAAKKAAKAA